MHLKEHIRYTTIGIGVWSAAGLVLLPKTWTYMDLQTILAIYFAALAPDIGNCGYYIAAGISGKQLPWNSDNWHRRETRLFAKMDKRSPWSAWYKIMHSAVIVFAVALFYWWYVNGIEPVTALCMLSYLGHLAMDLPTHKVSYIAYPFRPLEFKTFSDWWAKQQKIKNPTLM